MGLLMKKFVLAALFSFICIFPVSAFGQSYLKSFQKCTLKTPSGIKTTFSCRWMWNGITGGTIFVDNYDTDARYMVGSGPTDWHSTTMIGVDSKACIKSRRGAIVCLVNVKQR